MPSKIAHFSLICVLIFGFSSAVRAAEFVQETEKDFPLKTTGSLKILNQRGSISVVGWSMDRLRVKVKRKVEAATEEEAKKMFEGLELAFKDHGNDLELLIEGGRGMDLSQRLKERKGTRATVDLDVRGPANLKLELWGVQSQMKVHGWNAAISARASSGEISLSSISAGRGLVSAICSDCNVIFKDIHSSTRCVTEKGGIRLENLTSAEVFSETVSGALSFTDVKGNQTYVTTSGKIDGKRSSGVMEFRTRSGEVSLSDLTGSVSGHTDSGAIHFQVMDWSPNDKAALETESAAIELHLPYRLSSSVDFWAQEGKIDTDVPVRPYRLGRGQERVEPSAGQRLQGRLGAYGAPEEKTTFDKEDDIRVLSRKGNIIVRRSGS